MTTTRTLMSLATIALLCLVAATPAAGGEIALEGTLANADGQPLADGTHLFDVTLFSSKTGGYPLWRESHDDVFVTGGGYAVTLGSKVAIDLPPGIYWAEIAVDGEVLEPRTKMTLADGDCTITGNLIVEGGIAVGATYPNTEIEVVGNATPAGAAIIRSSYGPSYRNWFGEMKFTGADGLILNSQTGGTFAEIRFQNNGATNMFLRSNGNLGIGTDAPDTKLEAWGSARFGDRSTTPLIQGGIVDIHNPSGSGDSLVVTAYSFGTQKLFVVEGGGNVGIGNANPSHLLDVGNSGAYCNGGAWVSGSSRDFKDHIEELTTEDALATLTELKPTSFTYKSDPDEVTLGFIAEDVPDLVATNDRKGLVAMDIVAVLTKVVQSQQQQLTELRDELAALRGGTSD